MRFRRAMLLGVAVAVGVTLLPPTASASDFRLRVEDPTTGMGVSSMTMAPVT
jgi:hypothetical protein